MKLNIQFIKRSKMKLNITAQRELTHPLSPSDIRQKELGQDKPAARGGDVGVHSGDLLLLAKTAPCFPDPALTQSRASATGDGLDPPPSPRQHVPASGGGLEMCSHPRTPANKRLPKAETGLHKGAGERPQLLWEHHRRNTGTGLGRNRTVKKPRALAMRHHHHPTTEGRAKGQRKASQRKACRGWDRHTEKQKTLCFPGPTLLSCLGRVQLFMTP